MPKSEAGGSSLGQRVESAHSQLGAQIEQITSELDDLITMQNEKIALLQSGLGSSSEISAAREELDGYLAAQAEVLTAQRIFLDSSPVISRH